MKNLVLGFASVLGLGGLLSFAGTNAQRTPAQLAPAPSEVMACSGGSGAMSCACCVPSGPGDIVALNGFQDASHGMELTVYTTPQDKWLVVTDLEVVAMDDKGVVTDTYHVGLYEQDSMGMRMLKRWADCSPYHSSSGIAIRPGCDLMLTELQGVMPMPMAPQMNATHFYWQLNGYLWAGADTGGHTH